MSKKYSILITLAIIVILLTGVFYYLYNTYPNTPEILVKEEGYKVMTTLQFPKEEVPISVYKNTELVSTIQNSGSHFLEYLPPGNYIYEIRYNSKNLLGIEKNIQQTKELIVRELSSDELRNYFDFPVIDISTSKYGVYVSYPELKRFLKITITRNNQDIKTLSSATIKDEFLEHLPPSKYTYKVVFRNDEFENLDGFLRQDYNIEIEPISPIIISITPTPLYLGYSSEITATVENASTCKADLLMYPPSGYERSGPTVLKSHEFEIGNGFDYFSRHNESWSWKEILFPKPTDINTASYNMDLKLTCYDYYKSIHVEKTAKFPTSKELSQTSISISYFRNQSGTILGEIASNTWADLNCKLLIGDQSNYPLDEKNFLLQGRHLYDFDIGGYNRNFLYVTAICKNSQGYPITKISTYRAE